MASAVPVPSMSSSSDVCPKCHQSSMKKDQCGLEEVLVCHKCGYMSKAEDIDMRKAFTVQPIIAAAGKGTRSTLRCVHIYTASWFLVAILCLTKINGCIVAIDVRLMRIQKSQGVKDIKRFVAECLIHEC